MVVLPEAHPLCVKEKIEIENLEIQKLTKGKAATEAVQFFQTIQIDMSDFKFDRDEANER